MHVEDVGDVHYESNMLSVTMYVGDVGDSVKYLQCSLLNKQWLIDGGNMWLRSHFTKPKMQCPPNWGRKDSQLRFWLSTLPASTISLILALCFFHVDSVDWLILNLLQTSTAFKPESNLPSISIFSFSVLSVCWRLGFDTDILKANTKKHRVFISFWMHLFLMSETSEITSNIH